jgi:hypothetical protein
MTLTSSYHLIYQITMYTFALAFSSIIPIISFIDLDIQSIDGSSLIVPTDVKSVNILLFVKLFICASIKIIYWKHCAKKALDLLQKQALNRRAFMIKRQ